MTEPITLEAIKAQQNQLAEMIAKFEAQAKTDYVIPKATIVLNAGERYAGTILDEEGKPDYHLILLPGELGPVKWQVATKWAAEQGGKSPTLCEQSLLFANLKGRFTARYYWASEQHQDYAGYAWCYHFGHGTHNLTRVNNELPACAVRRIPFGEKW